MLAQPPPATQAAHSSKVTSNLPTAADLGRSAMERAQRLDVMLAHHLGLRGRYGEDAERDQTAENNRPEHECPVRKRNLCKVCCRNAHGNDWPRSAVLRTLLALQAKFPVMQGFAAGHTQIAHHAINSIRTE